MVISWITAECMLSLKVILCCHPVCILGITYGCISWEVIFCCNLVCFFGIIPKWGSLGKTLLCFHLVCNLGITPEWSWLLQALLCCHLVCKLGIVPDRGHQYKVLYLPSSVHLGRNMWVQVTRKSILFCYGDSTGVEISRKSSLSKGFWANKECFRPKARCSPMFPGSWHWNVNSSRWNLAKA